MNASMTNHTQNMCHFCDMKDNRFLRSLMQIVSTFFGQMADKTSDYDA